MKIWIVDAFTVKPYSGNPAGVMIMEDFPAAAICQQIAAEMNLSETVFIKPIAADHFHIRWFTPAVEVKLCGHGTIAASHILYQEKLAVGDKIRCDSLSGALFVSRKQTEFPLDFPLQKTGPALDIQILQQILATEILAAEQALDDVIVEMPDENAVRNFQPNIEKINAVACRGLIITARANKPYDFISRFFAPQVGVAEDPVTGSAHCKLADYWQKKLGKTAFVAYQASKRGGELRLQVQESRVLITGSAVTVMQGEWLIPVQ
jgi:PhzF family phenazine biosynthesis protein